MGGAWGKGDHVAPSEDMRLFLLPLVFVLYIYLEALAGSELVSSQLKRESGGTETCSADGVNGCEESEEVNSDISEHSSELPNAASPPVSSSNDTVESQSPVFPASINVDDETSELDNETAESHDTIKVVHDNPNNESNDNVSTLPDHLNCTCSTQDDESHDALMSRNISVKCSCLTGPKPNVVEGDEFKCKFHWNDGQLKHLKEKVLDWMKDRQKTFNRFTVPVMGYNNTELPMYGSNFTGVLTWVWLSKQQKYMVHFPHNFVSISTATMGVITQDWALDYDVSLVPPLRNHSIDIKDGIYQHEGSAIPSAWMQTGAVAWGNMKWSNF